MTVEWTQQAMSGGLPVTGYEVVVFGTRGQNRPVLNLTTMPTLDSDTNQLFLDRGIRPKKTYHIHIRTTNQIGKSVNGNSQSPTTSAKGTGA